MCTLALAWQVFEEMPVAVGANRDERLDRPAEGPSLFADSPRVLAPRDVQGRGTWICANEYGVFAGITNRWTETILEGERSRGLLVADALEKPSASEAAAHIERETARHSYEGFILVVADDSDAYCLEWDGTLEQTTFDPGVHVVVNVGYDDTFAVPASRSVAGNEQVANARRVRSELDALEGESADDWLERVGTVLGDHEYGVCIHANGFGTRSSSLLSVGEDVRYWFADGPPCENAYELIDAERWQSKR